MHRTQQTKHALGSDALLTLVLEDGVQPEPLFDALWQEIETFEQCFSRFLTDSELTTFNQGAGSRKSITPAFHDLLVTARDMAQKTQGLYNPLILPSLQRAGYKGSWPHPAIVDQSINYEHGILTDWDSIDIGSAWARIPKGSALDFGGIGKGYLLDMLSHQLQTDEVRGYWLSLGGDILCAGIDITSEPWRIAVQSAADPQATLANVTNNTNKLAIATSGITKRKGTTDSGTWHHLIDPRSGKPAVTDVLTATVCSSTAIEADVFAKCLVIVGSDQSHKLMEHIDLRNALLQLDTGSIRKIGSIWLDN